MKNIGSYLKRNYNKHFKLFRNKVINDTANEIAKDIVKDIPKANFKEVKKDIKRVLTLEVKEKQNGK